MIDWNYVVLGLSFLLLIFLVVKEVRRRNKARLVWRLLATILAITSLACIALPVTFTKKDKVTVAHEAILLTEGFTPDSVNPFVSAHHNHIPVIYTNENLNAAKNYNPVFLSDLSLFPQQFKDINTLHVFGYGLEQEELQALKDQTLIFHPTIIEAGITSIYWSQKIKTGEQLLLQGTYNNPSSAKTKIVLSNFNSTVDSVYVTAKNEKFSLSSFPKHAGRTVYALAVIAGTDTLEKETIPVQVEQGDPLKVLILASSPDFDNKFLKNQLSKHGYNVVARTAISKNKYVKDYLNTATIPLDRITPSVLDKFDITIADATELASLSKSELATIQVQVAQKSMGLIVKADTAISNASFYASHFPLSVMPGNGDEQIKVYVKDTSGSMPSTNIENPLFIRNQTGTQPIVFDRQNRVYANSALYGSGKVVLTTLTNTYSWALGGNDDDYNKFWSNLLNKAASKPAAEEAWFVSPTLPQVDKPTELHVETNNGNLPQGQVNGTSVYLTQNYHLPYRWTGNYYPVKEGWQTGVQLDGTLFYWYAYNKDTWKSVRALQKVKATEAYILENKKLLKKEEEIVKIDKTAVPKIYFLVLFLFFSGFLWMEEKNLLSGKLF